MQTENTTDTTTGLASTPPGLEIDLTSALATLQAPSLTLTDAPAVTPSQVEPAQGADGPALVYALGAVGFDFGTEARRDAFAQAMADSGNPQDPSQLLSHLADFPYEAASVMWTLNLDATPVYAVQPAGPFADVGYVRLREFLQQLRLAS